jgi:uncharacterized protein (TIGR01777 family)
LTERGDDVVVLSRETTQQSRCCGLGPRPAWKRGAGHVEVVTWDPRSPGAWMRVVDGANAVVHLAGAGVLDEAWTEPRRHELHASRVRSTELLAAAMGEAKAKPSVFVSASAVGVYGTETGAKTLTETDSPGEDFLARLCVDWEHAASAATDAGVRVCHPRIGLVLGRGGGVLQKMLPAFRAFAGGPVGTGEQYMPWVHIDDVVRAIEHAVDQPALVGPFNLTAPEPVTMLAFARALGAALKRPAVFRVPSSLVKLALGDRAAAVLTGQRAVPRRLVDTGFAFVFPELASALADLVG